MQYNIIMINNDNNATDHFTSYTLCVGIIMHLLIVYKIINNYVQCQYQISDTKFQDLV